MTDAERIAARIQDLWISGGFKLIIREITVLVKALEYAAYTEDWDADQLRKALRPWLGAKEDGDE